VVIGQLVDTKLKCVFELPSHGEPMQQQVTDVCSSSSSSSV